MRLMGTGAMGVLRRRIRDGKRWRLRLEEDIEIGELWRSSRCRRVSSVLLQDTGNGMEFRSLNTEPLRISILDIKSIWYQQRRPYAMLRLFQTHHFV